MQDPKQKKTILAHPNWEELIRLAEKTGWGKIEITLKDGIPTDIDALRPHIKLGTGETAEEIDKFRAVGA